MHSLPLNIGQIVECFLMIIILVYFWVPPDLIQLYWSWVPLIFMVKTNISKYQKVLNLCIYALMTSVEAFYSRDKKYLLVFNKRQGSLNYAALFP